VFAPSCPQPQGGSTIGPQDEDCLYLNVSTPRLNNHRHEKDLPVLVWIDPVASPVAVAGITTPQS
jgi:carboxylesterase type B